MKTKLIALASVLLISMTTVAQEMYTKLYDSPQDVLKGHVAFEYYGVDVGFSNTTGAMIFIVGVNGAYSVTPQINAEATVRLPVLTFEKQGTAFIFEGGANYTLNTSTNDKDVRVVLGYKEEDLANGMELHTTKYTVIRGSVQKKTLVRAGLYLKNSAIKYKESDFEQYKPTNLFHKGIYIGIGKQRQYFFTLQRRTGSGLTNFGAGSIFRPYFDVMILPTKVDLEEETLGLGAGRSKELSGFVGARAGFKWYRNPFTREQNGNHRLSFFGNSIVTLEAGVRPIDGFFINGGISFILKKFGSVPQ
jgi:hypothetical protein